MNPKLHKKDKLTELNIFCYLVSTLPRTNSNPDSPTLSCRHHFAYIGSVLDIPIEVTRSNLNLKLRKYLVKITWIKLLNQSTPKTYCELLVKT